VYKEKVESAEIVPTNLDTASSSSKKEKSSLPESSSSSLEEIKGMVKKGDGDDENEDNSDAESKGYLPIRPP